MKRQKPKRAVEPQRKLPRWPFKEREPERRLDAFRNLHPLILRKKLKTMAQLFWKEKIPNRKTPKRYKITLPPNLMDEFEKTIRRKKNAYDIGRI